MNQPLIIHFHAGAGHLMAEHFPLRGILKTRDREWSDRIQPRWQIIPAAPVMTELGMSTLLTENGWLVGQRYVTDALSEQLRHAHAEAQGGGHVDPATSIVIRNGSRLAFKPSKQSSPGLIDRLLHRRAIQGWLCGNNPPDPFQWSDGARLAWHANVTRFQRLASALIDLSPASAQAPFQIVMRVDHRSSWFTTCAPMMPRSDALSGFSAKKIAQDDFSLAELQEIAADIFDKGPCCHLRIKAGTIEPSGHRQLEAAEILDAWRRARRPD